MMRSTLAQHRCTVFHSRQRLLPQRMTHNLSPAPQGSSRAASEATEALREETSAARSALEARTAVHSSEGC